MMIISSIFFAILLIPVLLFLWFNYSTLAGLSPSASQTVVISAFIKLLFGWLLFAVLYFMVCFLIVYPLYLCWGSLGVLGIIVENWGIMDALKRSLGLFVRAVKSLFALAYLLGIVALILIGCVIFILLLVQLIISILASILAIIIPVAIWQLFVSVVAQLIVYAISSLFYGFTMGTLCLALFIYLRKYVLPLIHEEELKRRQSISGVAPPNV